MSRNKCPQPKSGTLRQRPRRMYGEDPENMPSPDSCLVFSRVDLLTSLTKRTEPNLNSRDGERLLGLLSRTSDDASIVIPDNVVVSSPDDDDDDNGDHSGSIRDETRPRRASFRGKETADEESRTSLTSGRQASGKWRDLSDEPGEILKVKLKRQVAGLRDVLAWIRNVEPFPARDHGDAGDSASNDDEQGIDSQQLPERVKRTGHGLIVPLMSTQSSVEMKTSATQGFAGTEVLAAQPIIASVAPAGQESIAKDKLSDLLKK